MNHIKYGIYIGAKRQAHDPVALKNEGIGWVLRMDTPNEGDPDWDQTEFLVLHNFISDGANQSRGLWTGTAAVIHNVINSFLYFLIRIFAQILWHLVDSCLTAFL